MGVLLPLAEEIRDVDPYIPLFFLKRQDDERGYIQGISGAGDYITKPFDSEGPAMKIKAILKTQDDLNRESEIKSSTPGSYHFNPKLRG